MSNGNQSGGCEEQKTMMKYVLYNHGPVKSIKEDILYRKELVEAVCDLIIKADTSESFTIGICGKWGTGKTSFVNFIKEKIGTEVGIIDFNPWIYTSQNDISVQFLDLLSYHLSSCLKKWCNRNKRKISKMTDCVAKINPDPGTSKLISSFSHLMVNDENGIPLNDMKKTISSKMSKRKDKIVVFIDDLDRLDKEEIRMVMKLVRSVADFPNIIYVLCFDNEIVEHALDTDFYDGHQYLQKIINIPISLPEFSHTTSINLLADHYLNITGKDTWNDYERSVINQFTDSLSLREVYLISTKFKILFNVSNNNTCPIDLLALQYIFIKSPQTYNWISDNRQKLCGAYLPPISELLSREKKTASDYYNNDDQDPSYAKLISILFPLFDHGSNNDKFKEQYRINNYLYIDNYFLLTPSSLIINDEDVECFLKYNPDEFYEYIDSNDQNIVVEMIRRVCMKIECYSEYNQYSMKLAEICLKQSFSDDKYIGINYARCMNWIVDQYLKNIPVLEDKMAYLQSNCPKDIYNIHKLISYGSIIDHIHFDTDDIYLKKPLYDTLYSYLSQNPGLNHVVDSIELMELIILIYRSDEKSAKDIFLRLMPSSSERSIFYNNLSKQGYEISFFTNMAGDHSVSIDE
ncbi:MAG: hypothetical protein A3204_06350 [Candidatus Methanarcanum hacksteinii]|nr:MAG: hypothetical protein A3204_06350 [Candidatus Methanarcanum hacksteinii]